MGGAVPPIEYTAPRSLAGSWWQAMRRAGLTTRFFAESYDLPIPLSSRQFVDDPTLFGGRVGRDEQMIAFLGWRWNGATNGTLTCVVHSKPLHSDIAHWVLIGSGVRKPRIANCRTEVDGDYLNAQIGWPERFYALDDRFWNEWSPIMAKFEFQIEPCASLLALPPPYFASATRLGKRLFVEQDIDVCAGPTDAPGRHFVVVRSQNQSRRVKAVLQDLEAAILQSGGRRLDIFADVLQDV